MTTKAPNGFRKLVAVRLMPRCLASLLLKIRRYSQLTAVVAPCYSCEDSMPKKRHLRSAALLESVIPPTNMAHGHRIAHMALAPRLQWQGSEWWPPESSLITSGTNIATVGIPIWHEPMIETTNTWRLIRWSKKKNCSLFRSSCEYLFINKENDTSTIIINQPSSWGSSYGLFLVFALLGTSTAEQADAAEKN